MRNNIFKTLKTFSIFVILIFSFAPALPNEELMQAMRDEIKRSMNELKLDAMQKPYYIEYTVTFRDSYSVRAALGSLVESNKIKTVQLNVGVRIGDYKFDNTNFFDIGLSFFGSSDDEENFKGRNIPIESDYKSLRRELWLSTDAAYKQALELYSKKEASLKNRLRKDTTVDFIFIAPEKNIDTFKIPAFNKAKYENLCIKASEIFRAYPLIATSSVVAEYIPKTVYYVNSEGREYIKTELFSGIEIVAYTQAEDGMPLSEYFTSYGRTPEELPEIDSILKATNKIANNLNSLYKSKLLEEPYSGPVLFEKNAAAELFLQVFAPNLVAQRQPLTEGGFQDNERYGAFQTKIGGRVLPEFFSVVAKPSLNKFEITPLSGFTKIDDDGVYAKDVELITAGYLKSLLSSRVPIKRVRETNGHRRGGSPMLSTLELSADTEKSMAYNDLKLRMVKLCKDRELPFGIIVKKILNQNIMYTSLYRLASGDFEFPRGDSKLLVVEAVKVMPDGSEELIRGALAAGFTVQSFKDIIAAGNSPYAYNCLSPSVISPYMSGGDQYVGVSVIVPDLLFEDGEIRALDSDFRKPPFIANPINTK